MDTDNNQTPTENAIPVQEQVVNTEVTTEKVEEVSTESTGEAVPAKKKKKGLIIGLIVAIVILLAGGGFAVFAIIKNLPENVAMNAFDNLIKAERITVDGSIDITPKNTASVGIEAVNLSFDTKMASAGQSTDASLKINFVDGTSAQVMNFGQVMMSNGVFYLKVDGLKEFYQDNIRDLLVMNLSNNIELQYQMNKVVDCDSATGEEYVDCVNNIRDTSMSDVVSDQLTEQIVGTIDDVVESIDGQWIEFSIEDILNSEFLTEQVAIPAMTRKEITASYNCMMDTTSRFSTDYANEFSDLYGQHAFLKLNSGQDGYYDVSFDADKLAGYMNNVSKLKFYQDFTKCVDVGVDLSEVEEISVDDVTEMIANMPNVAMKFDGFLDHHLTDMKVNQASDYYNISANMKFGYPSQLEVYAPTNTRPIMDVVEEIYDQIMQLSESF